jgi:multicomponent Na+:H+ antiporter subunit E
MHWTGPGRAALVLFAFWLVLSGSLHPVDLAMGLVVSAALGQWAARALWTGDVPVLSIRQAVRLVPYLVVLGRTIVAAAAHVAVLVLDRRLPVHPVMLTYRSRLTRDIARIAFANSLTLTPGTLAVDVDGDTFRIHCLAPEFAHRIVQGDLERQVARVFESG